MSVLSADIARFEELRGELEANHHQKWVVFHLGEFVEAFPDFETAAAEAIDRFDTGPFLIRQVGAPDEVRLTGGMVFTRTHA